MKRKELLNKAVVTTKAPIFTKKAVTAFCRANAFKSFLLVLLTVAITSGTYAQKNVVLGIKGGLNVSVLNYKDIDDTYDPIVSFHAGGLVNINLNRKWALQPEALASKEGFNDNRYSQRWRILYFNVPLMLQYKLTKNIRAELGPEFGFRINAQVSNNGAGFVTATTAYNQLNFSAAGGLSYLSKYNIGLSARYTMGLTDITQGNYNYVSTDVLQASIFYILGKSHPKW